MKRAVLTAALLSLAGPAFLASAHDMFKDMDSNHDGTITAQEHAAGAQAMFERMDANHDGNVTAAEMEAAHARMGKDMHGMQHDKDAMADSHMAGMQHDKDAMADSHMAGMQHDQAMAGHAGMGMHRMGSDMLAKMDTNGDGVLSASEHAAGASRMFAEMDTDHDGSLSRAEFDAGHAAMMHGDTDADDMPNKDKDQDSDGRK